MRRFGIIFVVVLAVAVWLWVRHRMVLRMMRSTPVAIEDRSIDVAATLRELSGKAADPADKGWATRFVEFVNNHPGRQWVVGRCTKPCLSESEAAQQAKVDAARKVFPVVARELGVGRVDADWLDHRIAQDVQDGRLEADRFVERFDRPYGQVWTESVLLDVSPANLDSIVDRYRSDLNVRHLQIRQRIAFATAAILATGLLYLLLNVMTKGYFTTRLRLAAATVIAAVAILLV